MRRPEVADLRKHSKIGVKHHRKFWRFSVRRTLPLVAVVSALCVTTAGVAHADTGLRQIPIPVPPVVTGLPYPRSCHAVGKLPDPVCTPGSVNPAVTQANIATTICKRGWTATVRPPQANTGPVKRAAMKAYGIPASASGTTELDHKIPLETGGSDDSSNLWPEVSDIPNAGFRNRKDIVEGDLRAGICSGKISLSAAQIAIATDWTTAEQVLGIK